MKLNIGCGAKIREGYEGLDAKDYGQQFVHDMRHPLPFEDESIEEIFSEHFLEHMDEPDKALAEMARVLQKRGLIILIVPGLKNEKAYSLEHRSYFNLETFRNVFKKHAIPLEATTLVENDRGDIYVELEKI